MGCFTLGTMSFWPIYFWASNIWDKVLSVFGSKTFWTETFVPNVTLAETSLAQSKYSDPKVLVPTVKQPNYESGKYLCSRLINWRTRSAVCWQKIILQSYVKFPKGVFYKLLTITLIFTNEWQLLIFADPLLISILNNIFKRKRNLNKNLNFINKFQFFCENN